MPLNQKLNEIHNRLGDDKLKHLFKCFYFDLQEDEDTLDIALNIFFGNFIEESTVENLKNKNWIQYFKSSIKEKYLVTKVNKKGSIDEKYKLKDPHQNTIYSLTSIDYIEKAKAKWGDIKFSLNEYFSKLTKPISKTLIYEAPPYLLSINEKGGINFEAEFIFDKNCSSPYVNAIRNCFNDDENSVVDIFIKNGVVFFDVIPIPIPINSDLREKWATDQKFRIEGKRIFVHFFEWALEIYAFKLGEKFNRNNHKIAIGIPLKNAVTIYEHAQKNADWPEFNLKNNFCAAHNFNESYNKPEGLWVQSYKNCIIGSSNTPSGELMKLAFEITSS